MIDKITHQRYRKGDYGVFAARLTDGSEVFHVFNLNECEDKIEAIDLAAAIRIADCLAENAV